MATITCLEPLDSAASDSGIQYELKMAALVALRAQQSQYDFQVFRNVAIALPFDDVVLRLSTGSASALVLMQLKHADGKGKSLDLQAFAPKKSIAETKTRDSNLREYFDFYGHLHRMVEKEEEKIPEDEKILQTTPVDRSSFMLYNDKVLKAMEKEVTKIEKMRKYSRYTSSPPQFQATSKRERKSKEKGDFNLRKYFEFYERLEEIRQKKTEGLSNDENFFRQTSLNGVSFIIYTNKVMKEMETEMENTYEFEKLLSTNTNKRSFSFTESCQMVWDLLGDGDRALLFRQEFLPRLRVFHQQAHVSELDNLILHEIQRLMEKPPPRDAAKQILRNLLQEVRVWAKANDGQCLHRGSFLLERAVAAEVRRQAWAAAGRLQFAREHCEALRETLLGHRRRTKRLRVCVQGTPTGVRATKLLQVLESIDEFRSKWMYLSDSIIETFSPRFLKTVCRTCDVIVLDSDLPSYQHAFQDLLTDLRDEQIVVHLVNSDSMEKKQTQMEEHWTLNQLTKECQERYLNRFINFQGKLITLKHLESIWNTMTHDVDAKLLAALGRKIPKFGNDVFTPQDATLPRRLSHPNVVSPRVLTDVGVLSGERLALQGFPKELLEEAARRLGYLDSKLDEDVVKNNPRWMVLNFKDEPSPKISKEFLQSLAQEKAAPVIHWLEYVCGRSVSDVCIVWKDSLGHTETMQSLVQPITDGCSSENPLCVHQSEMSLLHMKRLLIVGEAGVGKSTLLSKIASELKHADAAQWVVQIPILRYRDLLRKWSKGNEVTLDHVTQLVTCAAGAAEPGSPRRCLEAALRRSGGVSVLVDGVDEVASAFKDLVLRLLELLADHTPVRRLWITSRPEVDVSLRSVLRSPPIALLPFTRDQQRHFLCSRIDSDFESDIEGRAEEIVRVISERTDESLLAIPLHLQMVAEVVHLKWKGDFGFLRNFSLVNLYEEFLEQKRRLFENKYSLLPDEPLDFNEKHEKCAMLVLFADDPLAQELLPLDEIKEYVLNNDSLSKAKERSGIVWMDESRRLSFAHRTFAEFFAAKWLFAAAPSSVAVRSFVERSMRRPRALRSRVQLFLEELLDAGGYPSHSAAWRKDMRRVEEIVATRGATEQWKARDPLLRWTFGEYVAWAYEDSIKLFPEEQAAPFPWMIVAFKAAVESGCPAVVSEILRHGELPLSTLRSALRIAVVGKDIGHLHVARLLLEGGVEEDDTRPDTLLHAAAHRGSAAMVDLLLRHSRDLNARNLEGFSPLHVALERNPCYHRHDIAQRFLQEETVDIRMEDRVGYSPLSAAASADCASCIETLLRKGADPDGGGIPPLIAAASGNSLKAMRTLLQHGSRVNVVSEYGNHALHIAVFNGHKEAVQLLLMEGADANLGEEDDESPLDVALRHGKEEIANIIKGHMRSGKALKKGRLQDLEAIFALTTSAQSGCLEDVTAILKNAAALSATDLSGALRAAATGETSRHTEVVGVLLQHGAQEPQESKAVSALHCVAMGGNVATLELLLKGNPDLNGKDRYGRTPLHWAIGLNATSHRHEVAQRLLKEQSVDVNAESEDGASPLAYLSSCLSCAELLLRRGAKVDGASVSPLYCAAEANNVEILRFLVQNGARLNESNTKNGWTALHFAAFQGHTEATQLLLLEGADLTRRTFKGNTAAALALKQNKTEVADLLLVEAMKHNINQLLIKAAKDNDTERIRSLLVEGANPNARDEKENTALHWSARKGHQNALESLLLGGASVYSVNSKGSSAMHFASWLGHVSVMEQLLKHGAKVASRDCSGAGAMHHAARQGHLQALELFLKHGGDVNSVNDNGDTPLHVACRQGLGSVVKWLLRNGAKTKERNKSNESPLCLAKKQGHPDLVNIIRGEVIKE